MRDDVEAPVRCRVCASGEASPVWDEDEWKLVRCAGCDLVYVANPPDEARLKELYSFEGGFHTQLADEGDATSQVDRTAQLHLRIMAANGGVGRLLDVGCATGRFMAAAAGQGWDVHGVELNDDTASIARASGLDVTTGTLEDLPAPERPFEAVTMWDVIEHVPDPVSLLETGRRLLAPGGRLWLSTPNVDGIFPKASLRVADRVGAWPHPEPPYHLSQFSEQTIRHTLSLAGFDDVVVTHRRIPLGYTFGSPKKVLSDPKRLAYTAVFAPMALAGPLVRRGDTMVIGARPRSRTR
jgi:SAM-dependent methyltransferase